MGNCAKRLSALVAAAALSLACSCVLASGALADWAPVQSGPLNASGYSASIGNAATVGSTTYFGWAEDEYRGAYLTAIHVSKLSGGAITGEAPNPEDFSGADAGDGYESVPRLFAAGGHLYAILEGLGFVVLKLEGEAWVEQGEALEGEAGGLAESSEGLVLGYVEGTEPRSLVLDKLASKKWESLTTVVTPSSSEQSVRDVSVLEDGSAPIVAWLFEEQGYGGVKDGLYAGELKSGSFDDFDGGSPISEAGRVEAARTLVTIGGTPYLALGEETNSAEDLTRVLKLSASGEAFEQVGNVAQVAPDYYQLEPALVDYEGAPLVVAMSEEGETHPLARHLVGAAWEQLGGPLGVPPLPALNGDPYQFTAFADASGVPYVAIAQEPPGGEETFEPNLYIEAYTAGGTDPLGGGGGSGSLGVSTPSVTSGAVFSVEEPSSSPPPSNAPAASAALELVASPSIAGKAKLKLKTGVSVYCPAAGSACKGTVKLKLAKPKGAANVSFSIPAGATRAVTIVLPKRVSKALARAGAAKGSETVSASGPNGKSASLSQRLAAKLARKSRGKARKKGKR